MAKIKLTFPVFRHAASVTSGTGSLRVLAEDPGVSEMVFLTTAAPAATALIARVLDRAGVRLGPENHLTKAPGEPDAAGVTAAARFLDRHPARQLVAIGGGSVLDWARLAWATQAGLLDPLTGQLRSQDPGSARPRFWLVPTTCGTGAEAADVAVFQLPGGAKSAVVTPFFMADRVVLDARFLESLGRAQLAGFLCDALSHAIEGFLSLVPVPLGKEAAISALHTILAHYSAPPSPSRLERLLEASFLGGVAAANCSVGVVHAAAHALAMDGVPHGQANASGLLDGLRFNGGTAQMTGLLKRLGLRDVNELAERVKPVVADALAGIAPDSAVWRLGDEAYRRAVAARMQQDVAIRSNPRRPENSQELLTYLTGVQQTVEGLCRVTS
ncbi:MAG: iron-containing alcohol dehydrogenase [Gammaproteobacteria bacterium]|nr:iron-containing alcohol dehydrogenase [Gammaproteobacteria bacterium]